MARIAATAQVSADAKLADDVEVGPGAVIEGGCVIGAGCSIGAYTYIWQGAQIGRGNRIFPFCSLGGEPQDKKYRGEESCFIMGDHNTVREYCFFNRGTAAGGMQTCIGNNNWIMGYVHLAHDCLIGDDITVANCAQFAGHVEVGDGAVIGGGALFHQFRRIGAGAIIGGGEAVRQDVPPFALSARGVVAVNTEGMRRAGYNKEAVAQMKIAYKMLYGENLPLAESQQRILAMADEQDHQSSTALRLLSDFLLLKNLELIRPSR